MQSLWGCLMNLTKIFKKKCNYIVSIFNEIGKYSLQIPPEQRKFKREEFLKVYEKKIQSRL